MVWLCVCVWCVSVCLVCISVCVSKQVRHFSVFVCGKFGECGFVNMRVFCWDVFCLLFVV